MTQIGSSITYNSINSFKRFHFRYRHLKVLTEVAFLTCRGKEFQMAAPEYMNDLQFAVIVWRI